MESGSLIAELRLRPELKRNCVKWPANVACYPVGVILSIDGRSGSYDEQIVIYVSLMAKGSKTPLQKTKPKIRAQAVEKRFFWSCCQTWCTQNRLCKYCIWSIQSACADIVLKLVNAEMVCRRATMVHEVLVVEHKILLRCSFHVRDIACTALKPGVDECEQTAKCGLFDSVSSKCFCSLSPRRPRRRYHNVRLCIVSSSGHCGAFDVPVFQFFSDQEVSWASVL